MVGGQSKTPTISVLYERRDDYIGGAAVVAEHLRAAGAQVVLSTVLGNDGLKDFVLGGLKEHGIDCRAIIDQTRPTTHKNAIVAGGYRRVKGETVATSPMKFSTPAPSPDCRPPFPPARSGWPTARSRAAGAM